MAHYDEFRQRGILIPGGSGFLGTAVVRAFAEAGAQAMVSYVVDKEVERLQQALGPLAAKVHLQRADVSQPDQVEALMTQTIAQLGRLDALVNIVGGWAGGPPLWETPIADWQRQIELNLTTTFLACRAALPHLLKSGHGRIVNVSSRAALLKPEGQAPYAVSKAAVISLTEALAVELHRTGATANAILPSVIDTPANRSAMPDANFGHWVKPERIARVILWLCSDDAQIVSGAAIPVYGDA